MLRRIIVLAAALLVAVPALAACGRRAPVVLQGGKLKVVATTTIVGDVAKQVGGNAIDLTVLLPVGADSHSFEPAPRDAARLSEADIILANGAGLERFLDRLIQSAGTKAEVIYVSQGITLRQPTGDPAGHAEEGADHQDEGADPHVWTDPNNVILWTRNIEAALSRRDSKNAGRYRANADAYRDKLAELDAWMRGQVTQVPSGNRRLVTDHLVFGYLADRYGLEQVGAVFPNMTTLAEPSSQEVAALEDAIRRNNVKAIFAGNTVNPNLAQRVAGDTGARLVTLYTESLGAPGSGAETYLDYMRYNVSAIVEALK